ncbi:hypothetical protein D4Q76_02585 [archaeon]|nr:MAG: hypothetical protein D4Q76_02585 [archaeon]
MFNKIILAVFIMLASGANLVQGANFGITDPINSEPIIVQPIEQNTSITYNDTISYTPPATDINSNLTLVENNPVVNIGANLTANNNFVINATLNFSALPIIKINATLNHTIPPLIINATLNFSNSSLIVNVVLNTNNSSISVFNKNLSIAKKEKKILSPEDAIKVSKTMNKEFIKIELKEKMQKSVYLISGVKDKKIFSVFPVLMNVETEVDAETGKIISVSKPWWSFLAA